MGDISGMSSVMKEDVLLLTEISICHVAPGTSVNGARFAYDAI